MRHALRALLVVLTLTLCAPPAHAQCDPPDVSINVTTTGSFTKSCTLNPLTGRYDVVVTIEGPVTSNSFVNVYGGSSAMLGGLTVQNNSAIDCRINIRGYSAGSRIGGVGFIDRGTGGANKVLLIQLLTTGDVGYDAPTGVAIRTDSIRGVDTGGDMLGDMVSLGPSRSMGQMVIGGDLRGDIALGPTSSLDDLEVGGSISNPDGSPASLSITGNIGFLRAGSINANINCLAGGAQGTVHRIETTNGPFTGSLTCHRVGTLAGAPGTANFSIAGDLSATLAVTRDIRANFLVGGAFRATRIVQGVPIANSINTGTGFFDDAAAPADRVMNITGGFEGSMSLGTPLAAGLGSINRPITIGSALTGSITTQQDAAANISVLGPISGSITIGGSQRAGAIISTASTLTGPIAASGALAGRVEVGTAVSGAGRIEAGAGGLTGVVRIGGGLTGSGSVRVPFQGLAGQVIINANNTGSTWTGQVLFGGASLLVGPPYYQNLASSIGNGAIGLAPYRIHALDSQPDHDTQDAAQDLLPSHFTNPNSTPISIRSYGPMTVAQGFGITQSVAIEQLSGATWIDRSSQFVIRFVPAAASSSRTLTISGAGVGPLPTAGTYRVRPTHLLCAEVLGTPAVAWPNGSSSGNVPAYVFRVRDDCNTNGLSDHAEIVANPALDINGNGVLDSCEGPPPSCPCDWNHSNTLTPQDIFDFLSSWFLNNADFNGQNGTTVQDMFDFLRCFFEHPPGC